MKEPRKVIYHLVQIDDDPEQRMAICNAPGCTWRFVGEDKAEKRAAAYRHVAEINAPKEA